jgi:hypothetical protein
MRLQLLYPSLVKQVERLDNHVKATGKGTPVSTFLAVDSAGVGVGVAATARSGGVLS